MCCRCLLVLCHVSVLCFVCVSPIQCGVRELSLSVTQWHANGYSTSWSHDVLGDVLTQVCSSL